MKNFGKGVPIHYIPSNDSKCCAHCVKNGVDNSGVQSLVLTVDEPADRRPQHVEPIKSKGEEHRRFFNLLDEIDDEEDESEDEDTSVYPAEDARRHLSIDTTTTTAHL